MRTSIYARVPDTYARVPVHSFILIVTHTNEGPSIRGQGGPARQVGGWALTTTTTTTALPFKELLLPNIPGEDGSFVDETSGFPLIVASLNSYLKISQLLTIGLNLFKNTV